MNAKISMFVNCVEAMVYVLLYNLHDCTFKEQFRVNFKSIDFGPKNDPLT